MSLDAAVILIYLVLLSALLAVLARKFVFRTSPIFFAYICFYLVVGFAGLLVDRYLPGWYLYFIIFAIVADFIIYLYVLAELGKNVLRFNGAEYSYWQVACFIFLLAAVGIFSHTEWAVLPHRSLLSDIYYLAMRVSEVLAFAAFLAFMGWSTLRGLRWPDRELHIAAGFGFRTLEGFVVCILHTQWSEGEAYHRLDLAGQITDLAVLAYWLHYFFVGAGGAAAVQAANAASGKDQDDDDAGPTRRRGFAGGAFRAARNAERREFMPKVRSFLLAVAGAARSMRASLTDSRSGDAGKRKG